MAVCAWCQGEMTTAISCTVGALHRHGRHFDMIPFGDERDAWTGGDRCDDCGVVRGGFHHLGCDLQDCPVCGGQLISCSCWFDEDRLDPDDFQDCSANYDDDDLAGEPLGVDGNGLLTERMWIGDQEVIIHRDDVPETDITIVDGIRCTTALRTVIDIAPEVSLVHLHDAVTDCLVRGLFTVDDAWRRLAEPDMADRRGAELLRRVLPPSAA